ncbi:MAG: hypothetical protein K8W52_07225 [Deltaproteobacteria bacterium]|nr:hypothetical protein [Deltaproteobacteria bacterium]
MSDLTAPTLATMRLAEAVMQLDALDALATLYVQQPWSAASRCVSVLPEEGVLARDFEAATGLAYFLEVEVAREALGVFAGRSTTIADKIRLLVHYAEFDALPEWAQVPI